MLVDALLYLVHAVVTAVPVTVVALHYYMLVNDNACRRAR
jgi:hypothetical protein